MSLRVDGATAEHTGLPALMRGLVYGDGVFRTLLVRDGEIISAASQWTHLAEDAQRLGIEVGPLSDWLTDSQAALAGMADAALRWITVRGNHGRGQAPVGGAGVRVVDAAPLPRHAARFWSEGVGVFTHASALPVLPALAGLKHLNRLPLVLASDHWPDQQQEALLCDTDGHLVCGTRSNLFWVRQGQLHTPCLDRAGVAGHLRRRLRMIAMKEDVPVHEVRVPASALSAAEEVFITNSLIGIWPVRQVDDHRYVAPGPVTRRLMQALAHPWQGAL
ncbi:aminodeoxychorismate lyase [Flagellatimonas centrodinii]|uniref:aminodeoxychorismate lyase n=1 Tax=Flagellatimonas centrodinii TaxID=2806210 RepID=UPI001FF07894|nr:aminodeoxychorismate lyase [Flagellatimonas centrodinii]ULQ46258.1 aminodeoxychorismate lyase [Flagellatimonas centrodinii]